MAAEREPLERSWSYPVSLPVSRAREDILTALRQHPVSILCGATGSGKSTQLPKLCLEAGLGCRGLIGHTQPRRLAARALAERIAAELDSVPGGLVGWQVRFRSEVSADTRIKLMTDGVLLAELARDPKLQKYDALIIDEAHERSLNIDFLLGYLTRLHRQRPELRIIITSATLDAEKFSRHFDGAPVIDVPGTSYPVDLRYRQPDSDDLNDAIAQGVAELWRDEPGDVLVFLPGEREIREASQSLSRAPALARIRDLKILPLYARLGSAKQREIFEPGNAPRIILATNVAETSLTVPRVRHVIDSGLVRVSRYNPRSRIQGLQIEPVSRASADQRKGRCGRTAPGICIRLYSEEDFAARAEHSVPEIQRTNLAAVLLRMGQLKLGEPESFPFVDPPGRRYLNDARRLLRQLGTLDKGHQLTAIGRQLAQLPLDPRFGRIIIAAREKGCVSEALVVCAVLSIQDPRLRPPGQRDQAELSRREFNHAGSDFLSLLNLWRVMHEVRKEHGNAAFRRWAESRFLSVRLLFEWQDLVRQLSSAVRAAGLSRNAEPADGAQVHQSLLFGLIDHVGLHDADGQYRGPSGSHWRVHPESGLARRKAKWLVAAEIVTTRRTYARTVAAVQADWIEAAAGELLQREPIDPAWDARLGEAMARERVSLQGLILGARRRIRLSTLDADAAREIFISRALVEGDWGPAEPPDFLRDNLAAADEIRSEEARRRKRGLLRSDAEIADWYDRQLPQNVCGRHSLLRHLKRKDRPTLKFPPGFLRLQSTADDEEYPVSLLLDGLKYALSYHFEPGDERDGVSIEVPLIHLNRLTQSELDWSIPALLPQRIEAILRGLPKRLRRRYVPVGEFARACAEKLDDRQGDLCLRLDGALRDMTGQGPGVEALRAVTIEPALCMRIRVLDEEGCEVAASRDLAGLRAALGEAAQAGFTALQSDDWLIPTMSSWDCPDLPDQVLVGPERIPAFPGLQDDGDSVTLKLFETSATAADAHRRGLVRLLSLVQGARLKQIRRSLPETRATLLQLRLVPAAGPDDEPMIRLLGPRLLPAETADLDCALRAIAELQAPDAGIRTQAAFERRIEDTASALKARTIELWGDLTRIVKALASLQAPLQQLGLPDGIRRQARQQLACLLPGGFMQTVPYPIDLARYIAALDNRLQRAVHDPGTDQQRQRLVEPAWQALRSLSERCLAQQLSPPPSLQRLRWMIEEYRVSVFAQKLGTRERVSAKRVETAIAEARRELG